MYKNWNDAFLRLRDNLKDDEEYLEGKLLEKGEPMYSLSYEIQFQLDKFFYELVRLSHVKSGEYHYQSEAIYPSQSYNQSRNYESRQFGSEIVFGTTHDQFFIQTTLPAIDCIWQQYDDWWVSLAQLSKEYGLYFYKGVDYQESKNRNISELVKTISEYLVDVDNNKDLGCIFVTWGDIYNVESSIHEGGKVFKLIHKLNQALYRTKYIRTKSKNT